MPLKPPVPQAKRTMQQLAFEAGSIFTPGAPINARQLFSGRIDQVNKILDTVSQRGYHVILFGERGVGKTSLSNVLTEFLDDAGTGDKFLLPRVNCDASDNFSTLWRKQLQDIITTESRPDFGFNADAIEVNRNVLDTLPEHLSPDDVRRALEQLSKGVILVPIFDEFDRLRDGHVATLMADTIKALSDYSVDATVLLIGVADSVSELIHEHQSIERALVQIPMPRMSQRETGQIVIAGLARLSMTIEDDALDEISRLSQGLPYITHLLALHSTRATLQKDRLSIVAEDVDVGICRSLEQWQQSIKSAYHEATRSHQPGHIYKEVLLACALARTDELGYFSAADVREPLRAFTGRLYDIPNFARHLKELSEERRGNMLQRVGEKRRLRYRFDSPLMRPFIVMKGLSDGLIDKFQIRMLTAEEITF